VSHIEENLKRVLERIHKAAERAGRLPGDIRLVAVSKTVDVVRVMEAVRAGIRILGENYIQEARLKIPSVPREISWHFIGHLQTNKVRAAVELFDLIHSVDSARLAAELSRRAVSVGKTVDLLIQVNFAGETSKSGVPAGELRTLLDQIQGYPSLRVRGLMTMPPYFDDPERVRPLFRQLKTLMDSLNRSSWPPGIQLEELSMGMSGDFEVAVEEGATLVRVGTALFGTRP